MVFVSFRERDLSAWQGYDLSREVSKPSLSSLLPRLAEVRLMTRGSPTYTSPLLLLVYSWLPGTEGGKVLQHNSCVDIAYSHRSELG